MEVENYIEQKKELYNLVLKCVESTDDLNDDFENLLNYIEDKNLRSDRHELREIIYILLNIINNHHRTINFWDQIEKIFQIIEKETKEHFTNFEIFNFFISNKYFLLYLFKNEIIKIDEVIFNQIFQNKNLCHFFYPEISSFLNPEEKNEIKNQLLGINPEIFEQFDEKRQIGENESYICTLIRSDSIEKFVSYVNHKNIPLSSNINNSIFETNSFLLKMKKTSLIEYAAFFGSIQIFQYLKFNNVELTEKLWLYAIHGKNPDIIHLLEENDVEINDEKCLEESIKCHHNDFSNYIIDNLLEPKQDFQQEVGKIIFNTINFHVIFSNETSYYIKNIVFGNCEIVNLLLSNPNINIPKIAFARCNSIETINVISIDEIKKKTTLSNSFKDISILSTTKSIGKGAFKDCKSLKRITLPSSISQIGGGAFKRCPNLISVNITSSLLEISSRLFKKCSLLTEISIPQTVKLINDHAFYGCESLLHISIPSSVTSIGIDAFHDCVSLEKVSFEYPSSLSEFKSSVFNNCKSLKEISIPSSITSISNYAFNSCISLVNVNFDEPSSLILIDCNAFAHCSSLKKINIPNSVKYIKSGAFGFCSSLEQIHLPILLSKLEANILCQCSSLKQIFIPKNVQVIEYNAFTSCSALNSVIFEENSLLRTICAHVFKGCTSLKEMIIPPKVENIGIDAFMDCSSLTIVKIPPSVLFIRENAFKNCSKLTEIKIPSSVKTIGYQVFLGCPLKYMSVPSFITDFKKYTTFLGIKSNPKITKNAKLSK